MHIKYFENLVRRIVDQRIAAIPVARWGEVVSVNPDTHRIKATLEPENSASVASGGEAVVTGWMAFPVPVLGMSSPPKPGDQVLIHPEGGDPQHGIVGGSTYAGSDQPPSAPSSPGGASTVAQSGEWLYVSAGGGIFRMCKDGTGYMQVGTLNLVGNLVVKGNITASGNVTDGHGSMDRLRGNYNQHQHTGVQTGTGITGLTTEIDPE